MMTLSRNQAVWDKMKKKLGMDIKQKVMKPTIRDLVNFNENTAVSNLRNRIYAQPSSPSYTRTGRSLGGRKHEFISPLTAQVIFNTNIKRKAPKPNEKGYIPKEPTKDYSRFLDKNSRVARLNTHFKSDANDLTKRMSKITFLKNLKKAYEQI